VPSPWRIGDWAGGLINPGVLIAAEPADWLAGMTELGPVAWPPDPIKTERLVLREPEARDRAAFVELLASPEVHTYLGGPRPHDELEREMPEVPERWPGSFVVDLDGVMIGQILLRRASDGCRGEGRSRLPVPAAGVGIRVRLRGMHRGTRLARR
jgi:RimJ/RimL family protein N-acetyltransferase